MITVDRLEDMSPDGFLRLTLEEDGDIIIHVCDYDNGNNASVQFCTYSGGGGSHRTLRALRELMVAMALDNQDELARSHEFSGGDILKMTAGDVLKRING